MDSFQCEFMQWKIDHVDSSDSFITEPADKNHLFVNWAIQVASMFVVA